MGGSGSDQPHDSWRSGHLRNRSTAGALKTRGSVWRRRPAPALCSFGEERRRGSPAPHRTPSDTPYNNVESGVWRVFFDTDLMSLATFSVGIFATRSACET